MKLKKAIFASLAAVTIFSSGAAITASHNVETVQAAKKEGKKQKAKYQRWIKNRKKGNLVVVRPTKAFKQSIPLVNVNGTRHWTFKKGYAIPLYDPLWPSKTKLSYHKGHYYINNFKASDFKFVKYDKSYSKKWKYIKKHMDMTQWIRIKTKKSYKGFFAPYSTKKTKTIKANKFTTLEHPVLMKDGKGKYVISANSNAYDGYTYQIPYSIITKFANPNGRMFQFPESKY